MNLLTYAGASIVVVTFVWWLFERAEKVAKDDVRVLFGKWLKELELGAGLSLWPVKFAELFDTVFGKRHFTFRCFFSSSVVSVVAVSCLFLLYLSRGPVAIQAIFDAARLFALVPKAALTIVGDKIYDPAKLLPYSLLAVFVPALVLNLIPDYLSLLETRFVIRIMGARPTLLRMAVFLLVDLVVTTVIISVAFVVALAPMTWYIFTHYGGGSYVGYSTLEFASEIVWAILSSLFNLWISPTKNTLPFGIYFWSTFFTSAWIWIYVLTLLVWRFGSFFGSVWRHLRDGFLNVEEKPFQSIGYLASVITAAVFVIFGFLRFT